MNINKDVNMEEEHCYRVPSLETEPYGAIDSWERWINLFGDGHPLLMALLDAIYTQTTEIESTGYLYAFVHTQYI